MEALVGIELEAHRDNQVMHLHTAHLLEEGRTGPVEGRHIGLVGVAHIDLVALLRTGLEEGRNTPERTVEVLLAVPTGDTVLGEARRIVLAEEDIAVLEVVDRIGSGSTRLEGSPEGVAVGMMGDIGPDYNLAVLVRVQQYSL